MTTADLERLAADTPCSDVRKGALVWAAVRIAELEGAEATPRSIDELRREMISAGVSFDHSAVAAGLAADYALAAYIHGHSRGFNQGVLWQKGKSAQ